MSAEKTQQELFTEYLRNQPKNLPNSTAVLVLGIISIVTCFAYGVIGLSCGIIAIILAKKDKARYLENPRQYKESSFTNLTTGRTCAIIGVSLSGLAFCMLAMYITAFFSLFFGLLTNAAH